MCESCLDSSERSPSWSAPGGPPSRRGFLLLGAALLAGCARQRALVLLPGPPWPAEQPAAAPRPPAPVPASPDDPQRHWILPRATWAQEGPEPAQMNRMSPIRYITVHHDGMDPFYATDRGSVADHIEAIRVLHRRKGWGDIGYHFAIDGAGRLWEARSLRFQGAHVKDHNPGNIGVVVLGNFEIQQPTATQLEGVRRNLGMLMRAYAVPAGRVQSHREWGAATACPGTRLQAYLEQIRRAGNLG